MKEVSNHPQGDSMAAAIDKYDGAANSMAADAWSGRSISSDKKGAIANDENVKCIVITDLYGNTTKGCFSVPQDLPGKPLPLEPTGKPTLKPEIPADGGPKDPIKDIVKDPIKNQSLDGGIKKPMKPQVEDSIEFGEPFVKPVPKPGKVIKPNSYENNTLEK